MGARQLGAVMPESFALLLKDGGRHVKVRELFPKLRLELGVGLAIRGRAPS